MQAKQVVTGYQDSIPTEFASCVKYWCVLVDFIREMTVSADTNITSLDVANVTGFLQNWPYTRAVNQGGGLYRVWFNVGGAEYAICYSRDPFTLAFCLLLTTTSGPTKGGGWILNHVVGNPPI